MFISWIQATEVAVGIKRGQEPIRLSLLVAQNTDNAEAYQEKHKDEAEKDICA